MHARTHARTHAAKYSAGIKIMQLALIDDVLVTEFCPVFPKRFSPDVTHHRDNKEMEDDCTTVRITAVIKAVDLLLRVPMYSSATL